MKAITKIFTVFLIFHFAKLLLAVIEGMIGRQIGYFLLHSRV